MIFLADNSGNNGRRNDRVMIVHSPRARKPTGDSRARGYLGSGAAKDNTERLPDACEGCPHSDNFPACADHGDDIISVLRAQGLTSEKDPDNRFVHKIITYPETRNIPCFGGAEVHCHSIEHGEIIVKVNRPLTSCSVPFLVGPVFRKDMHVVVRQLMFASTIRYPNVVIIPSEDFSDSFYVSAGRVPLNRMKQAMQRVAAIAGYVSTAHILHHGEKPHLDEADNHRFVVPIPAELSVPDGVKVSAAIIEAGSIAEVKVTADFASAEQAGQMNPVLFPFAATQCLCPILVSVHGSTVTVIAADSPAYLAIVMHDALRAAHLIAENLKQTE